MNKKNLAAIPQIETLLQSPKLEYFIRTLSRNLVIDAARSVVESIRQEALGNHTPVPAFNEIISRLIESCAIAEKDKLQKVVNASGVILHTNMGRSPLGREIWQEAFEINCGYSSLELDLAKGKRGNRKGLIPRLMQSLVGCEDALIVNNNAAAILLVLQAFAYHKEVIISRGEQVQIGGGFRIPDILKQSGAKLVEIGTTNISTISDYENALTENTAMILSVHRSNFAIRGFTATPSIRELATIKPEGVLLCADQGSGILDESMPGEKSIKSYLINGADLVCFSADKVLGGPQAGIIAGKKNLIKKLESHPLMRVFRPGKTIYSLLQSTLIRRINGEKTYLAQTLSVNMEKLQTRGERILKGIDKDRAIIVSSRCTTGGGSLPDESFPSLAIRIDFNEKAKTILIRLRETRPPIIGMISDGKVHLDLSTIEDEQADYLNKQLKAIIGE